MEKELEKVKEVISAPLKEMDIVIDDISFYEKDKNQFLTIVLDKIGGIDLDTIVEASKIINKLIDEIDLSYDNYILDVTSKERG